MTRKTVEGSQDYFAVTFVDRYGPSLVAKDCPLRCGSGHMWLGRHWDSSDRSFREAVRAHIREYAVAESSIYSSVQRARMLTGMFFGGVETLILRDERVRRAVLLAEGLGAISQSDSDELNTETGVVNVATNTSRPADPARDNFTAVWNVADIRKNAAFFPVCQRFVEMLDRAGNS